jgi:hypothetical protein
MNLLAKFKFTLLAGLIIILFSIAYYSLISAGEKNELKLNQNIEGSSVIKIVNNQPVEEKVEEKNFSVKLVIDTGLNKYEFSKNAIAETTVFDLLKQISAENNFTFLYQESSMGVFVDEIYGVKNDAASNKYWLYKINGELANVGASAQKVKAGDKILWYYGVAEGFK